MRRRRGWSSFSPDETWDWAVPWPTAATDRASTRLNIRRRATNPAAVAVAVIPEPKHFRWELTIRKAGLGRAGLLRLSQNYGAARKNFEKHHRNTFATNQTAPYRKCGGRFLARPSFETASAGPPRRVQRRNLFVLRNLGRFPFGCTRHAITFAYLKWMMRWTWAMCMRLAVEGARKGSARWTRAGPAFARGFGAAGRPSGPCPTLQGPST